MNDIQIFKNEVSGEVKVSGTSEVKIVSRSNFLGREINVYGSIENPLFLAKDVAEWIEYDLSSINKLVNLVDDDEKVRNILPTLGGNQEMWFLTEDGLYEVLMQSRKPIAKQFKKGVKQILKQIRETGSYSAKPALPKTYLEALKELVVVVEANEMLTLENKAMKPKADYFDNLVQRNMLTNIRDTAKQIGAKEKEFVNFLLENNYMYRDKKKQLRPYAEHVPSLFQIKDYEYNGHAGQQVLITPKGKETFRLLVFNIVA